MSVYMRIVPERLNKIINLRRITLNKVYEGVEKDEAYRKGTFSFSTMSNFVYGGKKESGWRGKYQFVEMMCKVINVPVEIVDMDYQDKLLSLGVGWPENIKNEHDLDKYIALVKAKLAAEYSPASDEEDEETKKMITDIDTLDPVLSDDDISFLGDDTVSITDLEKELKTLFRGRKSPAPPVPGIDHVAGFFDEPISTGEGLKAESPLEAWVMAYLEKHMGEYSYRGRYLYQYGDRNQKRDAVIRKVKEEGAEKLFDQIAPPK